MPQNDIYRPEILDFKKSLDRARICALRRQRWIRVVDEMEEQLRELAYVRNPNLLVRGEKPSVTNDPATGKWIYLPWKHALIHLLARDDFRRVRLSRNRDLILSSEQSLFGKARIGIAGLNVGNPAAICLALEGGGDDMKLADMDTLSVSNLNRFRAGIGELGINKVFISASQVYEINPYARLKTYDGGITRENIDEFLTRPKLDVLIEEMDDLPLKVLIRERARHFRIPVVMVTGSGPDVVVDVERFDRHPGIAMLNGHLKQGIVDAVLGSDVRSMPFSEKIGLMRDFMGPKVLHNRLVKSFPLVGKTLAGIPQLAESSFLRGAAAAYVVRQIVTRKKMPSGRYILALSGLV